MRSSGSDLVLALVNPVLNFYFTAVVNPDPEVRSSGRVHSAFHLPFARPYIWNRICHCFLWSPNHQLFQKQNNSII